MSSQRELTLWTLLYHALTVGEIRFLFPSYQTAIRKLRRWCEQKRIFQVGTFRVNATGRPYDVFCRYKVPKNLVNHELITTKWFWPYRKEATDVARLPDVDPRYKMDIDFTIGDRRYAGETDRATEGYEQVVDRMSCYQGFAGFVLFVTTSEERISALQQRLEHLGDVMLFTTIEKCKKSPRGPIWVDCFGNRTSI